jgi:hypothetical protein
MAVSFDIPSTFHIHICHTHLSRTRVPGIKENVANCSNFPEWDFNTIS